MTDPKLFTENQRVLQAVAQVKATCGTKQFSDIIDGQYQYVDLVMEGAGVLGIALTGYSYLLEQANIRFLGLGGTSAGSINALMLAALGPPDAQKSGRLVEALGNMPMASFIDGDGDAQDFSRAMLDKARMSKLVWKAMQVMDNLKEDLGLNPGDAFTDWLTQALGAAGVHRADDLHSNLTSFPAGLRVRPGIRDDKPLVDDEKCGRLAMVAAEVTTETKVVFPEMAKLFWADPDAVNPALFARASMSIPLFFHPFRVKDCPQGPASVAAWSKHAGYDGTPVAEAIFIDGGTMSNFPINLFHDSGVPLAPTFGAKIGVDRSEPKKVEKPAQLLGAIFDAARHTLDYDFITQNPDYRKLVTMIKTHEDHNWLDFSMGDEAKVDLFATGAEHAAGFLCGFEWEKYKDIRRELGKAAARSWTAEGDGA